MDKKRYASPQYTLLPQPRPGNRETRYRPPRDRAMNHPRMEEPRHV